MTIVILLSMVILIVTMLNVKKVSVVGQNVVAPFFALKEEVE
jgi:uncharacterized membrane protein YuzA (DUF378 family)